MSSLVQTGERAVRVDVRAMAPGETAAVEFDERVGVQADDQPVDAPARGVLRIHRTNRGVTVRGRVDARVPLTCSRCLVPFQLPVAAEVEEEFSLEPVGGAPGELGAEDFVSWLGPGHELDLTEVVRQHLQISVPMAPLHAEDCRGLCPVCGTNWNERVCAHQRAEMS